MAANTEGGISTLLHHAGFAQPTDRAFLRVTGSDAARWLNGMVTNAAQALTPGAGNYNFLLNAQGRIQGDCLLFRDTLSVGGGPDTNRDSPEYLLVTDGGQVAAIQAHLDRYIIMDDVELTPAFENEASLLLLGPEAVDHLAALHLPSLAPLQIAHADTPHGSVLLFTAPVVSTPRIELRAGAATIAALQEQLRAQGVPEVSADLLEQLRVLEGTPRFGTDIRDRELPQETDQGHALHFAKGCYLGQEIVERIRSRGQVHRIFSAFRLEGSVPSLPAALEANGKPVGELTSAVQVSLEDGPALLALGYVRREALDTHAVLTYVGGTAQPRTLGRAG